MAAVVIANKNKCKHNVSGNNEGNDASSLKVEINSAQDLNEADEVEVQRAAGEPYYEEAADPTETYADGRGDYQYDDEAEEEAEEAEEEEEYEVEVGTAEEEAEAEAEDEQEQDDEDEYVIEVGTVEEEEAEAEDEQEDEDEYEVEVGTAEEEEAEEEAEAEEEEQEQDDEDEYEVEVGTAEEAEAEEEDDEDYEVEVGIAAEAASPLQAAPLATKYNESEKKRIVMSQLSSILDIRASQMQQLQRDEQWLSGLTRAVHRMNRARLCHVGCKPVTCHDEYCLAAEKLAQQFADQEAECGLTPELQAELQSCAAVFRLDNDDENQPMLILGKADDSDEMVGLIASRIEFEDFDNLPVDSINSWYKIETHVDFLAASQDPDDQLRANHYIQLLDCNCLRVGWAAAPVGSDPSSGVAYVVAVFDHAAVNDEDSLDNVPRKVDATTFE